MVQSTVDVLVKVRLKEFDERLLDEVERYSAWMDLAEELARKESDWLVRLT